MEYCGGGSVADLMHASDAPLDQDMIAYICAETLAGLTYLHAIGKVRSSYKQLHNHRCMHCMYLQQKGCSHNVEAHALFEVVPP